MTDKKLSILYWVSTVFVALLMGFAGVLFLLQVDAAQTVLRHLGYPAYFATLMGVTRLLGSGALLLPVPGGVREWAYAGLTFDIAATIVSILLSGLPPLAIIQPLIVLAVLLGSYLCWHKRVRRGAPRAAAAGVGA